MIQKKGKTYVCIIVWTKKYWEDAERGKRKKEKEIDRYSENKRDNERERQRDRETERER